MILTPLPCPDCKGSGVDARRGGLCGRCSGSGKTRLTAAEQEERARLMALCKCQGGLGNCDGACCS